MATIDDIHLLLEIIHFSAELKGRKRFQKMVCVMKHQNKIPLSFNFIPYFYGPYSKELAKIIHLLVGTGYVEEVADEVGLGVYQYNYSLTERGKNEVSRVIDQNTPIHNVLPTKLKTIVSQINDMELNELVRLSKSLDLK